MHDILQLDIAGVPDKWIRPRDAIKHIAEGGVAWSLGSAVSVFHGGYRRDGSRSVLEAPSIIAVTGKPKCRHDDAPVAITREKIFRRDRNTCAYCGQVLESRHLEAEHIIPKSRGGEWSWMNLVASCSECNQVKKRDRTPAEAGMPLLYLPYAPSRWEDMILRSRNILADQMEFLLGNVPKHSRLL